ncbi:hypothetical protein [Streptomyces sp. NPDC018055]|uniref:hypothetical protein n=1 Tax=Streptomyces sp. NPDC018055 TaxID=3365038 RepID=UPI0037A8F708
MDQVEGIDGQQGVTIKQVCKVWRGGSEAGGSRAAVRRMRYRAVGTNWGHSGGGGRQPLRVLERGVTPDECALGAICVSLRASEPDDEVYLVVPQSLADLLNDVRASGVSHLPPSVREYVEQAMPALSRAEIEVRPRLAFRDLFSLVSQKREENRFNSLLDAAQAVDRGYATRSRVADPVAIDAPGWVTDWGRSLKFDGAAVGFAPVFQGGSWDGTVFVSEVPQEPEVVDGELAAVLVAYAYARTVSGLPVGVFYSDSRDTAKHLANFVQEERPGRYGTLLRGLAAPFSDEELLDIEVRWIYKSLSQVHRSVDHAARLVSRGENVPEEAVVELDWLLNEVQAFGGQR